MAAAYGFDRRVGHLSTHELELIAAGGAGLSRELGAYSQEAAGDELGRRVDRVAASAIAPSVQGVFRLPDCLLVKTMDFLPFSEISRLLHAESEEKVCVKDVVQIFQDAAGLDSVIDMLESRIACVERLIDDTEGEAWCLTMREKLAAAPIPLTAKDARVLGESIVWDIVLATHQIEERPKQEVVSDVLRSFKGGLFIPAIGPVLDEAMRITDLSSLESQMSVLLDTNMLFAYIDLLIESEEVIVPPHVVERLLERREFDALDHLFSEKRGFVFVWEYVREQDFTASEYQELFTRSATWKCVRNRAEMKGMVFATLLYRGKKEEIQDLVPHLTENEWIKFGLRFFVLSAEEVPVDSDLLNQVVLSEDVRLHEEYLQRLLAEKKYMPAIEYYRKMIGVCSKKYVFELFIHTMMTEYLSDNCPVEPIANVFQSYEAYIKNRLFDIKDRDIKRGCLESFVLQGHFRKICELLEQIDGPFFRADVTLVVGAYVFHYGRNEVEREIPHLPPRVQNELLRALFFKDLGIFCRQLVGCDPFSRW